MQIVHISLGQYAIERIETQSKRSNNPGNQNAIAKQFQFYCLSFFGFPLFPALFVLLKFQTFSNGPIKPAAKAFYVAASKAMAKSINLINVLVIALENFIIISFSHTVSINFTTFCLRWLQQLKFH